MMKKILLILSIVIIFLAIVHVENSCAQAQIVNSGSPETTYTFTDDFSGYPSIANQCLDDGTLFGNWQTAFDGYGCVRIVSDGSTNSYLYSSPKVSTTPKELHAALVLGPSFSDKFVFEVDMNTHAQQRIGSTPNFWEVGWILWDFTDESHAYYFTPKPNGWELGKLDPAYQGGQRYLDTEPDPTFPINNWYHVKITQYGNTITVYVDGKLITSFTDLERPYTHGKIGLYNEDATVYFDNIKVSSGQTTPPPPAVPTPPTGLRATAISSSEIDLIWTAPINDGGSAITGYKIDRSRDGGSTWKTVTANTDSLNTTFSHSEISAGSTYTYRVYAINGIGTSPPSNTAFATTLSTVPQPPTGLRATTISSSEIDLIWTAAQNGGSPISGYKIEVSIDSGSTWNTVIANTSKKITTFTHTGLTANKTYTYHVYAINSIGTSSASDIATAKTISSATTPEFGSFVEMIILISIIGVLIISIKFKTNS